MSVIAKSTTEATRQRSHWTYCRAPRVDQAIRAALTEPCASPCRPGPLWDSGVAHRADLLAQRPDNITCSPRLLLRCGSLDQGQEAPHLSQVAGSVSRLQSRRHLSARSPQELGCGSWGKHTFQELCCGRSASTISRLGPIWIANLHPGEYSIAGLGEFLEISSRHAIEMLRKLHICKLSFVPEMVLQTAATV